MADLSQLSTEELMRMRGGGDLSRMSTEDLLKLRAQASPTVTADMSTGERIAAGAGKAVYDVGRGAGQIARSVLPGKVSDFLGLPTQEDIDAARSRDAPLMATGGGIAGNVIGGAAMFAPTAMIPGANTVTGAAVTGGVMGALQPTAADESRLKNTVLGAGTGAVTQYSVGKLANALGAAKQSAAATTATEEVRNATRDAALEAGRKAGLVVPPSTVNPTIGNQLVETAGGKIATEQTAAVKNAPVFDRLAREALGLQKGSLLTEGSLADMRKQAGQAYRAIKNVGGKLDADAAFAADIQNIGADFSQAAAEFPESTKNAAIEALNKDLAIGSWSPTAIVEKVKLLRSDATANFKAFNDPEKLALARAQREAANALDGLVERRLNDMGQGALATAYKDARRTIAISHDVETALMPDGHINALTLAKISDKHPLSGPLDLIAQFAGNFPKASQPVSKIGSPATTALRASIGSGAGAVVGGTLGAGVGGAVGFVAPWTARQLMLSTPGQALLATPRYGPGTVGTVADLLALPAVRKSLPAIGAASALNYSAQQ